MIMDYSGCSSDKDLVTFVDWTEEAPNVFINFRDDPTKPGRMNCYNGDSLKYWLNQSENTVAKWVQNPESRPIEPMGYGGMPDPKYKYIKMYTNEYIVKDDIVSKLQKGVKYPVILDANYTTTERIGNLAGQFTVGGVHGQLPGYRVYKLKTDKPLELENQEEIERVEEEEEYVRPRVLFRSYDPEEIEERERRLDMLETQEGERVEEDPVQTEAIVLENILIYVKIVRPDLENAQEQKFRRALNSLVLSEREQLSLANRIAFEISAQFSQGAVTSENILKATNKTRHHLNILYEVMGDRAGEEAVPAFLESQEFVDQMTIRMHMYNIYNMLGYGEFDDNEVEDFKEIAKKYGLAARYFLVEGLARWGAEEELTVDWLQISIGVLSPSTARDPILISRKAFASIVARSRAVANYDVTRIIDTEEYEYEFGIPRDLQIYKDIIEQPVTKPDTFKNMMDFYTKLSSTGLIRIKKLL